MIRKSLILCIGAVAGFGAAPAYAAPVLMTCTVTDSAGESVFDVQLNEEAGIANYFVRRHQLAVTRRAIFTPDLVTFNGFTIDRKDLTFVRDADGAVGKCVIDTTKRAF